MYLVLYTKLNLLLTLQYECEVIISSGVWFLESSLFFY